MKADKLVLMALLVSIVALPGLRAMDNSDDSESSDELNIDMSSANEEVNFDEVVEVTKKIDTADTEEKLNKLKNGFSKNILANAVALYLLKILLNQYRPLQKILLKKNRGNAESFLENDIYGPPPTPNANYAKRLNSSNFAQCCAWEVKEDTPLYWDKFSEIKKMFIFQLGIIGFMEISLREKISPCVLSLYNIKTNNDVTLEKLINHSGAYENIKKRIQEILNEPHSTMPEKKLCLALDGLSLFIVPKTELKNLDDTIGINFLLLTTNNLSKNHIDDIKKSLPNTTIATDYDPDRYTFSWNRIWLSFKYYASSFGMYNLRQEKIGIPR